VAEEAAFARAGTTSQSTLPTQIFPPACSFAAGSLRETEQDELGRVCHQPRLRGAVLATVPKRHVARGVAVAGVAGLVVGKHPVRATLVEQMHRQVDTRREPIAVARAELLVSSTA